MAAPSLRPELGRATFLGQQPKLNSDQAAAIQALTSSGHGVHTVYAMAGTAKTTMLAKLAASYPPPTPTTG